MTQATDKDNGSSLWPANWRQLTLLGGILVLAVIGLDYFPWQPPSSGNHRTASSADQSADTAPDIIITDPVIEKFDAQGTRTNLLRGSQLQHFESDNHSLITNPVVDFQQHQSDGTSTPWQLSANSALLLHESQTIDLQGQVRLFSDATTGGRTEITTEQLLLDTARQFAETDKTVTIRARRSEAHATGLKADLANERLLLPSRVKETHESRRR